MRIKPSVRGLLIFLVSAPFVSTSAESQTPSGTIHGSVRDEQGAAIANANVEIVCGVERRRTATGATGEFSESGLPATRCSVEAGAPLLESGRAQLDLTRGGTATTTLVLHVSPFATGVVVTPTRGIGESASDVPASISVVSRERIDQRPHTLLPQVLREEAGILLQQTTTAQASPVIRGFTGQSNVYLIDGVRLNTSAWRSGPSQYLGWIEGAAVDRIEIVRGPGSVQYGSDALGGTINVLTVQPAFSATGTRVGGLFELDVRSADSSSGGQADLLIQGPAAAFRFGGGTRHVEDLRAGGGRDSHAAVTRFLGLPSTTLGSRLTGTAFDQTGGYVVGHVRAGETATIRTMYMHEDQSGANRYDRLTGGDGLYRSGFTPQTLDFGLVRYQRQGIAGFEEVSGTFSVNRQADGRFEQARPTTVVDQQRAVTTALGYQIEGHRRIGARHRVSVGTEVFDETIDASRQQVNAPTGVVTPNRPDIPDGTAYANTGLFAQDVTNLVPGRVSVRAGVRYGYFRFSTVADPSFGVPAERVAMQALTFHAGTVVNVTKELSATFVASRGFRAPNAFDFGGIGLTGGGGLEVAPSRAAALGGLVGTSRGTDAVSTRQAPALGPEVLYAFEPGLRIHSGRFDAAVTGYDLEYLDSIQRRAIVFPTRVVGETIAGYEIVAQDATGLAYIAQDARPIATGANVDHARILGFEADGSVNIARRWTAAAFFSMSNGRVLRTGEHLRRMPPGLGGAKLRWSGDRSWVEGVVSFAARQTRLSSGDLTDARIGATRTRTSVANYFNGTASDLGLVNGGILVATGETLAQVQARVLGSAVSAPMSDAAPGFVAIGARAGRRISPHVDLIVIGENLTDRNYRLYGSGVDAPGINVEVKLRVHF